MDEMEKPREQEHPLLAELLTSVKSGFDHDLIEAYISAPSQETIEDYLDKCRRRKEADHGS